MKFKLIHIICLLFAYHIGFTQLHIVATPDSLATKNYFALHETVFDEVLLNEHLSNKIDSLRQVGYLSSSVDSLTVIKDTARVKLFLGERIKQVELKNGNVEEDDFQQLQPHKVKSWEQIEQLRHTIQQQYLENGYLNATTYFKAVDYQPNKITLELVVEKGIKYQFNQLILNGDVPVEEDYLQHLFGIEENEYVTAKTLRRIEQVAQASSYFQLANPPKLGLNELGFADIYLTLNNKKANQFDLLIGLLPNPINTTTTANKVRVTGEGVLRLVNPFGRGREIGINYKQLQPESPILNGNLYLPQILKQPFGLRSQFNLEKQDTSFLTLDFGAKLDYQFGKNQHFLVGYQAGNSYLQRVDTVQVKQTKQLPNSSDYQLSVYQIGYTNNNLNGTIAPTKGFQIRSNLSVGTRKIQPNSSVVNLVGDNSFDYSNLYNGLNDKKLLLQGELFGQYFVPLQSNSTILLQTNTAYKSLHQYFENDLYRLGGINTIRGFDERSYLASAYSINTAEYRLLLSQNSFFSVFSDLAYTQNEREQQNDFLMGLGTGLDLETQAGIFAINLAVGKNKELPFDFSRSRIHFSYVNVF